jgi:fatty-acyl-CoA synthase
LMRKCALAAEYLITAKEMCLMEKVNMQPEEHARPLMSVTIGDLMRKWAREIPDNECVVYPQGGKRWTWKQMDELTDRVARGFMAMGIRKDDKVAIWASNVPEWIITFFAAAKMGAVLVTVNTNYKQFELEYLLRQSDTHTLIMIGECKGNNYVNHVRGLCKDLDSTRPGELVNKKLPFLKNLVYIGERSDTPQGFYNFEDIYGLADGVSPEEYARVTESIVPEDVVNMQYTSGTTGFPKGVMLTHYNVTNNGQGIGDCMDLTTQDRLLIVVPLFHCFGCVLGVESCLTHGSTMVFVDLYKPKTVLDVLQAERCTAVHGVPTMFIGYLEHPDFKQYDFSHLRTGIMAGSPCPINYMRRVVEEMHMRDIVITYGQTECSPGMTMSRKTDPLELRVTTVGRLLPHVEGKIIDPETGNEQPCGVPGEICTRGYHLMRGYYKMPEATRQAIDSEGWLHTGDIGTVDENGYYKITGRLKDMIIRGGENIYPREIEEFLYTNPKVSDVQVVGVPDKKYGEEVCAYVVLKENETATADELISFVKNGLSRFKAPHYVLFVSTFPMTASGKIQKFKLREMAVHDLHLEDAAAIETA